VALAQKTKKERKKRQWQTGYSPRPPTTPYRNQSLHAGWPPVCSSVYTSSFIKIGPVVSALWVVKNRPLPLLWPLAYTTACTTVQAVILTGFLFMCNEVKFKFIIICTRIY